MLQSAARQKREHKKEKGMNIMSSERVTFAKNLIRATV